MIYFFTAKTQNRKDRIGDLAIWRLNFGLSSLHQRLYLFCRYWNILHQVLIAIAGDPEIILNAYAHLLFFNVNTGLDCEDHPSLDGFGTGAEIMNIYTEMMGYAMVQVFPVSAIGRIFILNIRFFQESYLLKNKRSLISYFLCVV